MDITDDSAFYSSSKRFFNVTVASEYLYADYATEQYIVEARDKLMESVKSKDRFVQCVISWENAGIPDVQPTLTLNPDSPNILLGFWFYVLATLAGSSLWYRFYVRFMTSEFTWTLKKVISIDDTITGPRQVMAYSNAHVIGMTPVDEWRALCEKHKLHSYDMCRITDAAETMESDMGEIQEAYYETEQVVEQKKKNKFVHDLNQALLQ